ncbi:MAG: aminopeptidase [Microgenomates group bacterium]
MVYHRHYCFSSWSSKKIRQAFEFAEGYKKFLTAAKTERLVVRWIAEKAKKVGFQEISFRPQKFGKKIFLINRDKSIILAIKGKKCLKEGVRILTAHIDSPRLDLKALPLYEEEKLAFFKTHYYGGIKPYQWPALPLAIYGTVAKENGQKIEIAVGDKPQDPVFILTDLLPHLAEKQLEKKLAEAIEGENLNLLVGAWEEKEKGKKEEKDLVKQKILKILNDCYGLIEEDIFSADLEIVPAGEARDGGWDKSLVVGYGQDDRVCAYTAWQAFLAVDNPSYTTVLILLDREEIGSEGVTGATSSFIKDFLASLLTAENPKATENDLRDMLAVSKAISADVTAALDPNFKEVSDPITAPRLGAGLVVEKHTGGKGKAYVSEASAEYTAWIRKVLNQAGVIWQPAAGIGKVDLRGGGTVGMFFARHNIEVIDAGVALLNMHAPFEVAHKGDIYCAFEGYKAFLEAQ